MKKILTNFGIIALVVAICLMVCHVVMADQVTEPSTVVYYGKDPVSFTCTWGKKGYEVTHTAGCSNIYVVMKKKDDKH